MIQANSYYDQKADVWSASVTIFGLFARKLPYTGKNISQMNNSIKTKDLPKLFNGPAWANVSDKARDFI